MVLCVHCISSHSKVESLNNDGDIIIAGVLLCQAAIFFTFISSFSKSNKHLEKYIASYQNINAPVFV